MRRRAAGPVGATIPEGGGVCAAGTTAEAAAAGRLEATGAEGGEEAGLRRTGRDTDMVHTTEGNKGKVHYGKKLRLGEPTACVTNPPRKVLG